jgi:U3 small nucleolar RNA-associated protein 20
LLESVFTTLAYLFKYLLRQLLDGLVEVYSMYIPLLSSKRKYVRQFAAESFAYLIRQLPPAKVPDAIRGILHEAVKISDSTSENGFLGDRKLSNLLHGFSQLLFHSMKVSLLEFLQ